MAFCFGRAAGFAQKTKTSPQIALRTLIYTDQESPVEHFDLFIRMIRVHRGEVLGFLQSWPDLQGPDFHLLIYQITHLPVSSSLDLNRRSHISFFRLVMGSAVRIRHCPATVSAENLSNMPLGENVPGRRSRFI
jgi:hypothetical protein